MTRQDCRDIGISAGFGSIAGIVGGIAVSAVAAATVGVSTGAVAEMATAVTVGAAVGTAIGVAAAGATVAGIRADNLCDKFRPHAYFGSLIAVASGVAVAAFTLIDTQEAPDSHACQGYEVMLAPDEPKMTVKAPTRCAVTL